MPWIKDSVSDYFNAIRIGEDKSDEELQKAANTINNYIKEKGNDLNISTIYRVMEFWCKTGIIHKISALNKFFTCSNPNEVHLHVINICSKCEELMESCNKKMGLDFKKGSKSLGLSMTPNAHIEIPVICKGCQ